MGIAKLPARTSTNGHAIRTRPTPSDRSTNVAPSDHRTLQTHLTDALRRPTSSKGAPVRCVLVAFAVLWALVGATLSAPPAGAIVERSATIVAGSLKLDGQSPQDLTANCRHWVTAPANVDHSLLEGVCADVVSDLAGIGTRLGLPVLAPTSSRLTDPLAIVFAPTNENSKTLAVTGYFNGVKHHLKPGSPGEGFVTEPCQITLFPLMYDNEHALLGGVSDRLHVLLSHEVVHCYQDVVFTYKEATDGSLPAFLTEGSATYLATSYAGYGEQGTPSFWSQGWLGIPGRDLTGRGYDAVGWYSLVAHVTGNDLWSKMVDAWRTFESGGSSAFISALGGDSVSVERAWGASMVNQPTWGDAWTTPGIGVPIGAKPAEIAGVLGAAGGSNGGTLQPWAAVIDKEPSVPDGLLEISVSGGYASAHDDLGHSALGFTDAVFCVGSKACRDTGVACTSGGAPLNLAPLTTPFTVAVNSIDTDARYTITSITSPENPATPVDLPSSAGDCTPPTGKTAIAYSEGDPHLATFTNGALDFQAAGEYTLVQSKDHSLDVQVRQQPMNRSRTVAEDTAVAMLVGRTRLEVDAGNPGRLLINGAVTHLDGTSVRFLRGGGSVHADRQGDIFVKWPDRCTAAIESFPGGLDIFFGAPQRLVGSLHGLLNSVVTGASPLATDMVLVGGNGKRYVVDPASNSGFRTIYRSFAPSWAITKRGSLFTYPPGKRPRSYLVKGFPSRNYGAATVPAYLLGLYESRCRADGIINGNLLRGCVIDQAALGTKYIDLVLRAIVRALALYTLTQGPTSQSTSPTSVTTTTAPPSPPSTVPPVSRGSTLPTDVSASTVEAIVKHPCTLLTESEADAAAGTRFAKQFELAGAGLCSYTANPANNSPINVDVELGTVAEDLPPKFANTFIPEPGLGRGVVWVVEKGGPKGTGELWFPLGKVASQSYSVQVEFPRGGLPEASTIARDCFSHM